MKNLFKGIYKGKKVLLTGHTGFKGSWLMIWLQQLGAEVVGFSLKPNTDPSHFDLLKNDAISIMGDLRDTSLIAKAVAEYKPEIVFHLAAQPLVQRSYAEPIETFETNIIGTANLYEAIRSAGSVKAVVNITTDKVYQNKEWVWGYRENDPLGGQDPYSTSKACVELVHECYKKSYFREAGIFSATARAGNVIGGGDWAEDRLIPDIVTAASIKASTDIRNPHSVRPWQHVLDPLAGYLLLGQQLLERNSIAEDGWNFGPSMEDCLPVNKILDLFTKYWEGIRWNDVSVNKKLHESNILRLDCSKAFHHLQWSPVWNIETAIEKTATWYKQFYSDGLITTNNNIQEYISDAAARNAVWTN